MLFWEKKEFLGNEVRYFMVIIAYSLNQICNIAIACKNDASVAKITNRRLTKIFVAIFALAERLPTSATLFHCNQCLVLTDSSRVLFEAP